MLPSCDTLDNGMRDGDEHSFNNRHMAVVDLEQKFKLLGNYTVLTTKVKQLKFVYQHLVLPTLHD